MFQQNPPQQGQDNTSPRTVAVTPHTKKIPLQHHGAFSSTHLNQPKNLQQMTPNLTSESATQDTVILHDAPLYTIMQRVFSGICYE